MDKKKYLYINFFCLSFYVLFFGINIAAQDFDGDLNSIRGNWFLKDRAYPYDTIPVNSMIEALHHKEENTANYGYFLDPYTSWVSLGPKPYYTPGSFSSKPFAGRIQSVKYMPYISGQHDPNILFIAGHNGGIWKTTNLQISNNEVNVIFNPLTDDLPTQSAGAIGIDPTDPQIIYYASGGSVMYFAYNFYGIGVFKSTNGGLSWTGPYNTGLPRLTHSFRITVSPNHDVYLALGMDDVNGGLYKSTDGGLNWAHAPDITLQKTCNDVAISNNGQYIYALGESPEKGGIGYWISTNSGQSFSDFTQSSGLLIPNYQRGRSQMSISKGYENYVYVVTVAHNTQEPEWVYGFVSTDYGFTFGEHKYINGAYGLMSSDFMDIKASPHNPEIAVVGFGSGGAHTIFMTTNGGNTYPQMFNCGSFPGTDINSIDFNPNPSYPNQVVVGCDQGLFINDNVLYPSEYCWKFLNKTLSLSQVYRVSSNPFNFYNINIAQTDAGILRKRLDQTNNWDETFVGCDGTNIVFSKYNNGIVIGSTGINNPRPNGCGSNMMYSSNGGLNWSNNENSFEGYWDGDQDWIAVLTEYPGGGKFYHARRQEGDHRKIDFYYTLNGGQTWSNSQGSNYINPITTVDLEGRESPQTLTFVETSPNIIYVSTKNWHSYPDDVSRIYKTTNNGLNWINLEVQDNGVPNRVITDFCIDPKPGYENYLYLTVSGFAASTPNNIGHVFSSTNAGLTWHDISSTPYSSASLPDVPVNQMIVRRIPDGKKELIVSTDAGVYHVIEGGTIQYLQWKQLAPGLPNSVALGLDFNEAALKLNVATFGRGVYTVGLEGPVYVSNELVLSSDDAGLDVNDNIVVAADAKLKISSNCTIKMPAGKKIIVENGGQIDISSGASVTFTSQTGEWGGIEFQGDSYGTLRNCTFQNTSTPIVIEGDPFGSADPPDIIIDSCNFNAPIEITNRKDVTIEYCNFNYSSGSAPSVLGIFSSGSDNALFSNNSINSGSSISSTGISVVYGSGIVIQKNAINNMAVGISVSNTSPLVSQNRITNGSSSSAIVGIGFDNSYSAAVKQNTVIGYQIGYKLYNSSPEMYLDSSYNTSTSGDSVNGLHAVYLSNPRLKPGESIGGIIWDAGKNDLKSINKGNGIYMYLNSVPILDYGYNHIWGYNNYLIGDGPEVSEYYVRCNNWADDPPVSSEFNLSLPGSVVYSPYGCTPPGGSGYSSFKAISDPEEDIEDPENPPAFIVVNYGHGIYDTIKVTTGTNNIPADQNIYGEAVNEELTCNYSTAIAKYKNLLTNHQTSILARNSLKKILNCYVKMNADSNQYSDLRNYYLSLLQQYPGDTAFVKASKELAVKTLVKKGEFANAITEYENLITGNNDMHEVLCCELNIIETYMLMQEEGDAPGFTGNIASLKPLSKKDGYRKIMEKLYGVRLTQNNPVIPVQFSLSQNYPNPFNPLTKINYSLPKGTKVNIRVYDLLGRLVKTLVNEFKEAGSYDVHFDGTGLASGVYFYRIEAGDFVDSKKMVLVK